MRAAPASFIAGALASTVLSVSGAALADVNLFTELSPHKVEVGARFRLQLRAMGDGNDSASDPQLKLPPGITGSGPSVGSQSSVSIVNGQMTQSVGITATWILVASQPGKYKLGPASVQTANGRKSDRAVTIEVVAQGSLPTPPLAGQPFDPFSMLNGLGGPGFQGFPGFPGMDGQQELEQLPQLPEEFRIQRPLDPIAFVRAHASPRRVVVGEQVTLSNYAYAGRGSFEPGAVGEPSRDDFLAFNLMDDVHQISGYQFDLEGQRWITAKISEFALFPLKAGRLKAGAMSMAFVGRNYSRDPQGLTRASLPVEIEVVEPPLSGRPPGYRIGDVGHYSVNAEVSPREVPAGGSISIVAKLEGTGNLPFALLVPEQNGVRFLEPQLVDQVAPKHGIVQGFRTFTYVVELTQPGDLDLGEITLPFWDPKARAYGVARATLGKVKVTGVLKPETPSAKTGDAGTPHLKGLIKPPTTLGSLGAASASASYWPSRNGFWLLLLGLPLSAVLGFALSDLAKLLGRRMAERKGSLATALDEALAQLASSARAGDATATAGAAERALFLGIEKTTGLKGRGILKSELAGALSKAEVPADVAERTAALLARCDELRFAGEAVELPTFAAEVRETCQKIAQRKPRAPGNGAA